MKKHKEMKEGRLASLERASVLSMSDDPKDQDKAREIKTRFDYQSLRRQIKKSSTKESVEDIKDDKYNVSEEGLRDWFGKSSGTTKSGRKVKGWVQVGGKYDGKPCARQPGQKSTPKCVSSSKRRSMSDKERDSAARRKRAADPNQPQKSGAAKPTNVSTDPKRKMKENYFNRDKVIEGFKGYADLSHMQTPKQKKEAEERFKKFTANTYREMKKKDKIKIGESKKMVKVKLNPKKEIGVKVTDIGPGGKEVVRKNTMNEAKDKKGKGSGTKDACYHKVKSRYSVWPSAYASGALVKCRKKGAANWGNKSKNEGFSPMQVAALEVAGMIEIKEGQKCWKGYEKKGTKKMFGKTYNNCVKKEEVEQIDELSKTTTANYLYKAKVDKDYVHSGKMGKYAKARDKGLERAEKKLGSKISKKVKYDADYDARSMKKDPNESEYPRKYKVKEGVSFDIKQTKTQKLQKMSQSNSPNEAAIAKKKLEQRKDKEAKLPKLESYAKVIEGVAFLKRKKEERKPQKAMDAGSRGRRLLKRKEYAAKISGSEDLVPDDIRDHVELTSESKTRLIKNGYTYKVVLTWRGKTYMVQMFVPSVSRPTRLEVEKEVQKLYPDAKVLSFLPKDLEPGEPTVMMGEEKRDEYGDPVGGPKISKKQKAKNLAKNEKDEDHTTTTAEEYVAEDDMKGMSVGSGHKRPTKSGAGMTAKGVAAYRRRNPGSKLQTAVTGKVKKGSKDAKRRKSYCARSAGQMKKFPKAAKDPNSRLRQARRRWKC